MLLVKVYHTFFIFKFVCAGKAGMLVVGATTEMVIQYEAKQSVILHILELHLKLHCRITFSYIISHYAVRAFGTCMRNCLPLTLVSNYCCS